MTEQDAFSEKRLRSRLVELRERIREHEELVRALQADEVDAVVVLEQQGARLARLHTDEPLYRTIVDTLPQCVASVLADGTLVYLNEHLAKSIGSTPEESIGKSLFGAIAERDRNGFTSMLTRALEAPQEEVFGFRWPEGEAPSVFSATRLPVYGTDTIGLVIMDVREQVARQTAEEAARAKDELLASVSHELRIPLTALTGWIQLLEIETGDEEPVRHALREMQNAVQAQRRLVEDLLDLGRSERGGLTLHSESLDLRETLHTAVGFVRLQAENKGLEVRVDLPEESLTVRGDPDRLRQVFVNLLSNALKFTNEGEVSVHAGKEGAFATVAVVDTGIGISSDFLPYVFETFRRGPATRAYPGIGIGLSISRRLVEAHGGTIEATSDGVDAGATFRVRLPLAEG